MVVDETSTPNESANNPAGNGETNNTPAANGEANANQQQVAKVIVIDDHVKTITVGNKTYQTMEEKIGAIRNFLRGKILRQFDIVSMNNVKTSTEPLSFNGQMVQTKIKLPKPLTNPAGVYCETLEEYVKRVTPDIKVWMAKAGYNSLAQEAALSKVLN